MQAASPSEAVPPPSSAGQETAKPDEKQEEEAAGSLGSELVYQSVVQLLQQHNVQYRCIMEHKVTTTSEESARERNEPLAVGGKALLMRANGEFHLFVLSAASRLSTKAIKQRMGKKAGLRFATPDELASLTGGLVPGSVPPFGQPVLPFPLHVDVQMTQQPRIAFNAGLLTRSIIIDDINAYLSAAKPDVWSFAEPVPVPEPTTS